MNKKRVKLHLYGRAGASSHRYIFFSDYVERDHHDDILGIQMTKNWSKKMAKDVFVVNVDSNLQSCFFTDVHYINEVKRHPLYDP